MTNFEKVKEFHTAFEVEMPKEPTWPKTKLKKLRMRLIREETREVRDAIKNKDIVNLAKELADLLYVVYGFGESIGIDLDKVFAEVHASNMTKLGEDGKPIRREDGKVLKGPNYRPADIESIIYDK